jgi:hypothetical protein
MAEDEAQAAWDGLGGRLEALWREVVGVKVEVNTGQTHVKAVVAEVKADVAEVKAGQAEAKADMEAVKADVSEVKTGQAGVKALLEKRVAQSLRNAA